MDFLKSPITFKQRKISHNFVNSFGLLLFISSVLCLWEKRPDITGITIALFVACFLICFCVISLINYFARKTFLFAKEEDDVAIWGSLVFWSLVGIISISLALLLPT